MQKTVALSLFLSLLLFSLPITSMDPVSDRYALVSFETDNGIVAIEKKNIPLIGALYERYDIYLQSSYKNTNIAILLLPGTAKKEEIALVNKALNARPDTFKDYFTALTKAERDTLVRVSMSFKQNGRTVGLCVPEMTRRLLDIYISGGEKDLYGYVTSFLEETKKGKDDVQRIMNYCRKTLMESKRCIGMIKKSAPQNAAGCGFWDKIDIKSSFVNGQSNVDDHINPIPLSINGVVYPTYAYNFVSESCEYRITQDPKGQASDYLLWAIDHGHPSVTFATSIKHKGPLKGCCFSPLKSNTQYVITYSETDIWVSKIMSDDGRHAITNTTIKPNGQASIISVAYSSERDALFVGLYDKMDNAILCYDMASAQINRFTYIYPFQQNGFLKKIMIAKNNRYIEQVFFVFKFLEQCRVIYHTIDNNHELWESTCPEFLNISSHNDMYGFRYSNIIALKDEDRLFAYNFFASPFKVLYEAARKKEKLTMWQSMIQDIPIEPTDECYRSYSPSGMFLMCNSLKKEMGMLYIETHIKDAITHELLLSVDTLHENCKAIGFDHKSEHLLFENSVGFTEQIVLSNDEDRSNLNTFQDLLAKNLATRSLMYQLHCEIQQIGKITLKKEDPIYVMFQEWGRLPNMLKFMQTCFPLNLVKA